MRGYNQVSFATSLQEAHAKPAVNRIAPLADPRWGRFISTHPRASVFHSVPWLDALRRTYAYEMSVLTTSPPGEPLRNGMVVCPVNSWLTGRRLVSLPFSDHCEPLVDERLDRSAILEELEREVCERKLQYLEVRPVGVLESEIELSRTYHAYCSHRLDLTPAIEVLFHNCHKSSTQRKIKRAEREGLRYEEGGSDFLLDVFFELLAMTRRRHQIPPQPKTWFKNLIQCFGGDLKIRVAFQKRRALAAILTLRFGEVLTYKYGGSDPQFHNLGGTHLLFWKAIQEGKREGAATFDLGRSDQENTGLIVFKDRWGAMRTTLSYTRFTAHPGSKGSYGRGPSGLNKLGRYALSHLPRGILDRAGTTLYRHMG